jgi:hypothetical protein
MGQWRVAAGEPANRFQGEHAIHAGRVPDQHHVRDESANRDTRPKLHAYPAAVASDNAKLVLPTTGAGSPGALGRQWQVRRRRVWWWAVWRRRRAVPPLAFLIIGGNPDEPNNSTVSVRSCARTPVVPARRRRCRPAAQPGPGKCNPPVLPHGLPVLLRQRTHRRNGITAMPPEPHDPVVLILSDRGRRRHRGHSGRSASDPSTSNRRADCGPIQPTAGDVPAAEARPDASILWRRLCGLLSRGSARRRRGHAMPCR